MTAKDVPKTDIDCVVQVSERAWIGEMEVRGCVQVQARNFSGSISKRA